MYITLFQDRHWMLYLCITSQDFWRMCFLFALFSARTWLHILLVSFISDTFFLCRLTLILWLWNFFHCSLFCTQLQTCPTRKHNELHKDDALQRHTHRSSEKVPLPTIPLCHTALQSLEITNSTTKKITPTQNFVPKQNAHTYKGETITSVMS